MADDERITADTPDTPDTYAREAHSTGTIVNRYEIKIELKLKMLRKMRGDIIMCLYDSGCWA